MKFMLLATLASFSLAFFTLKEGIGIGDSMPMADAKMKDVSGKFLSLEEVKEENGTLVIFSCNTCPFVIATQDRYHEVAKMAKANGLGLMVVNSNEAQRMGVDSYAAMQDYAKDQNYTFPYVLDNHHALADAFGATRTPDVFLFDAEDRLVYKGAIDDSHRDAGAVKEKFLEKAIKHLSQGKAIDPAETKAVGCTIKRVSK